MCRSGAAKKRLRAATKQLEGVPYSALFIKEGAEHNVDAYLLAAQAKWESVRFNPDVIACRRDSSAGARGISQLMPGTAKSLGVNPCIPEQAIDGQARMMAGLLKKYDGNESLALAGYNAGPNRAKRALRFFSETRKYVPGVLSWREEMKK